MADIFPVGLPPAEAVEFFRRKGLKPSFAWQDVYAEEHARAFTVAKVAQVDILEDMRGAVDAAIADGETFADFKKRLIPTLQEKGWWGKARMVDPKDGEEKDVQLGSVRRLGTIYDTNLRTAHAAGRWEQVQRTAETRPYLRYVHLDNGNPREQHKAWHGMVLRTDDPFWNTAFPPNGFGCHCSVQQLSPRQLDRYGYKVAPSPPKNPVTTPWTNPRTGAVRHLPPGVSPGFDHNPGVAGREVAARVLGERLAEAKAETGAASWAQAAAQVLPDLERGYARWVDEIVARRDPQGDVHPVGALSPKTVERLRQLDHAPAAAGLVLDAPVAKRITSVGGPLTGISQRTRLDLVRRLPSLLANPRAVYYDAAKRELLYLLASPDGYAGNLVVRVARAAKAKKKGGSASGVTDAQLVPASATLETLAGLTSLPVGPL